MRRYALNTIFDEIAASYPETLETALPGIFAEQPFLRQLYKAEKSTLDNYRASFALASLINPSLERHAPERLQAVKEQYAAQMAAIEAQMVAL